MKITDINKINEVLANALACAAQKEDIPGSVWADEFFYLPKESSGVEQKWTTRPSQILWIDSICNKWIEKVVIRKAKRVGGTKCTLAGILYGIAQRNANTRIYRPTESLAEWYMLREVDTVLRDVPAVRELLLDADINKKSKYNTSSIKVFKNCILDVVSGSTETMYCDINADTVVLDELTLFPPDVNGAGDPPSLAFGRTDAAAFPKMVLLTTPRKEENTLIDSAISQCEVVMSRYLTCPVCGTHQVLRFKNLDIETASFSCIGEDCDNTFVYSDFPSLDRNGFWANNDLSVRYDDNKHIFTDAKGSRIDVPVSLGLLIWGAYSYEKNWEYICREWKKAMAKKKEGDITYLKAFVNLILGETYRPEAKKVKFERLLALRVPGTSWHRPEDRIPNDVLLVTCGVDVQGTWLEYEFVGWGEMEHSWSLEYGKIPGDPFRDDIWAHLDDKLVRTFTREDGVTLRTRCAMIDAGYLTKKVYAYTVQREVHEVYSVMGVSRGTMPNKPSLKGELNTRLYTSNTIEFFDMLSIRLKVFDDSTGRIYVPGDRPDEYFEQLGNFEKVARKTKYGVFNGWGYDKADNHKRNEACDVLHYNTVAKNKLNLHFPTLKAQLQAAALAR